MNITYRAKGYISNRYDIPFNKLIIDSVTQNKMYIYVHLSTRNIFGFVTGRYLVQINGEFITGAKQED